HCVESRFYGTLLDDGAKSCGWLGIIREARLAKHADVAFALAHDDGSGAREIDDTRRLEAAIAAIDHRVDDVVEPFLYFPGVAHRRFFAGQNQGRAHQRLSEQLQDRARDGMIRHSDADRAAL